MMHVRAIAIMTVLMGTILLAFYATIEQPYGPAFWAGCLMAFLGWNIGTLVGHALGFPRIGRLVGITTFLTLFVALLIKHG